MKMAWIVLVACVMLLRSTSFHSLIRSFTRSQLLSHQTKGTSMAKPCRHNSAPVCFAFISLTGRFAFQCPAGTTQCLNVTTGAASVDNDMNMEDDTSDSTDTNTIITIGAVSAGVMVMVAGVGKNENHLIV